MFAVGLGVAFSSFNVELLIVTSSENLDKNRRSDNIFGNRFFNSTVGMMDASVKVENVKPEVENNNPSSDSFLDMNQVTNLAAHLQLMQQAEGQVPWMISPYHMMVFSQGVSPIITQNLLALQQDNENSTMFNDSQVAEGLAQNQHNDLSTKSLVPGVESTLAPHLVSTSGANLITSISETNISSSSIKSKAAIGRPPKKPLTPYMIFSKQIWPQVKAANSHLSSVCEIGAIVGSLWRDMDPTDKKVYNDLFAKDKERYDKELREYLKVTGMSASDLAKPRVKRTISGVKINPSSGHSHGQTINQLTSQVLNGMSTSSTVHVANEQIFTQMDLSNSLIQTGDGSINIDANGLANLLAIQQQHLLSAKPGDIPPSLDNPEQVGSWMLQHQPADVFVNNLQQHATVLNIHPALGLASPNIQTASLSTAEQLIKSETDQSSVLQAPLSDLEAEVVRTRALLDNATSDVERLTAELQQAFIIIQQLKEINESSIIIPKVENEGRILMKRESPPLSIHLNENDKSLRDIQESKANDEQVGNLKTEENE